MDACGTWPTCDGTWPTCDGTWSTCDETWPTCDGTQPTSDGTWPTYDGTWPTCDGTRPTCDGTWPTCDGTRPTCDGTWPTCDGTYNLLAKQLVSRKKEEKRERETERERVNSINKTDCSKKSLVKVGDQIFDVLKTDRKSNETVTDAKLFSFLSSYRCVGHYTTNTHTHTYVCSTQISGLTDLLYCT